MGYIDPGNWATDIGNQLSNLFAGNLCTASPARYNVSLVLQLAAWPTYS